jgi:lysophospholipase L1-like esterase
MAATTKQHRKLAIIGDGFAEGFGDYVTIGSVAGMASSLSSCIRQDALVKMTWKVLNLGKSGTGTSDWIPSGDLFQSTFDHKAYADADIVLICLGANDARPGPKHNSPTDTVQNLKKMCAALQESGKRVAVSTLLCAHENIAQSTSEQAWNEETNKLLKNYFQECKNDKNPVLPGPALNAPKLVARSQYYAFDGIHFNSAGYKMIGKDAKDALHSHIKAVEWAEFKDMLSADTEYMSDLKEQLSTPLAKKTK